jgi:alpha-1,2-mannosyltransferase
LQGMGFPASKILGWIYTLILVAIIYIVARRKNDSPLTWLAILILATLRSPFLPLTYATFPPLWLLSLVIALHSPSPKILLMLILGWLCLETNIPVDSGFDPRLTSIITAVPQILMIVLSVIALKQTELSPIDEISTMPAGHLIMTGNG